MKAFLLAAGHGTRLRPLTDSIPKCLVPIRETPLLGIWLELCRRSGVDEILINLHSHADVVEEYLRKKNLGIRVELSRETVLLGSAGTLRANRQWVRDETCFWILYADVLTTADLRRMWQFHLKRKPVATLGVYAVPDPQRCGIVEFDQDGTVQGFVEKPAEPTSHWAFSGVMVGTPELLDSIPASEPADLGFDVLPRLADKCVAYTIGDYLLDVGTIENYRLAQETWPGFS